MSKQSFLATRRDLLTTAAVVGVAAFIPSALYAATPSEEIRPFKVSFPQSDLDELPRRVAATRWPDRETVTDTTQGVQLATIQKLATYWAKDYDWSRMQAQLDALPQFITEIDRLDIHFIHVRSKHENALPIIVTHGWPRDAKAMSDPHRATPNLVEHRDGSLGSAPCRGVVTRAIYSAGTTVRAYEGRGFRILLAG
jgi:hypothetical protein